MGPCVLRGAVATGAKLKDTPLDKKVSPPSAVHCEVVLFHVSTWKARVVRFTYRRTRLKSDAARILVTATALDTLRASPLTRNSLRTFPNIGTAIALMMPIRPQTKIISK